MTTKAKRILAVGFMVILLGIFAFWLIGPSSIPAPESVFMAAVQKPKALQWSAQVEKPVAPPVASSPMAQPAMASLNDAQKKALAELRLFIPNLANDFRTGRGLFDYKTPEDLAHLGYTPEFIAHERATEVYALSLADQEGASSMKNLLETVARSYEAIAGQVPTLNTAGDEATYLFTEDTAEDMESGTFSGQGDQRSLTFIKINGQWYFKPDPSRWEPDAKPEPAPNPEPDAKPDSMADPFESDPFAP